ncbi:probable E3 ubiquitin-protein ligase HERC4 isoform X1 [Leptopilina heterotoma]|uniref:probable E3 ubiquitin-protein ligase HERC4 isoform X1 n=2 Tax=Leptopilina heterotoma TaxID=63436 RepID=UPI001CA8A290|nr:probable E3 ubiquitin-protein ligase HERC4 isoform X1 [Leptopilina heterotoma]XP_043466154.1 probable E3 ubiquitin-protein ligase HERC4 isoform X1 [Leptopilina heterotoma]
MASWSKKRRLDSDFDLKITPTNLHKEMFCWGSTVHGELGLGGIEEENILSPRAVDFIKAPEVEQIACGENYTIVITRDGQIYSCGNNDSGQLGHEKDWQKRLELIPGLDAFVFKKVACGAYHNLVVNEWGQLFCWGCNTDGQLGLDSTSIGEGYPRILKALGTSVVVQIACGLKHALALTNNGELYSWGSNKEGQLGLGPNIKKELKPKLISSLVGIPIAFIACGGYHCIVVSKSGAIFGWGRNNFGQLGLNDTQGRLLPSQLRTLRNSKVRYVSCGEEFSVFLTMDGGVFTCGAGMYGQLGHGSYSNEILPRQVAELMGSVVTQVTCGRKHTLAFVPRGGRAYAWGLGGAGQLGIRIAKSVTTPQVILGPWLSSQDVYSSKVEPSLSPYAKNCTLKHIFSGGSGNHCFATVTQIKDNIEADDCRILAPSSQILTVTEEQLIACQKVPFGASVDHDLLTYLETVFRSLACINASFFLANDAHYGCSSKHHGIDINQAKKLFGIISELDNVTIKELISSCILDLLKCLVPSPPDVETLRIYVVLPLYHGFADSTNCDTLHKPFTKAVLDLKHEAKKIVGLWWRSTPAIYFERLVRIYKAVVQNFLKQTKITENKPIPQDYMLKLSLTMLKFLYDLNQNSEGQRVSYDVFHLPDLVNLINIQLDYYIWLTDNSQMHRIHLCDYPFLFDAEAKTILLETDQAIQMQSAMNEAATRNITRMFLNMFSASGHVQQFVMLNVSRENLVDDTLRELSQYESSDLKKPLRVKFHGEEAEDAGGVKKEFFMLLLKEILDPKYGMFREYEETRTIWFNEYTFEDVKMYFLIGLLCGLVIYNFIIIDLPFPLALYKKLLNEPVDINDIKDMDPICAKSFQDILNYTESDFEDVFCLNFEITREVYGENKIYELIPGGSKVPVTLENKKQYVDLMIDYILNKSVENQFEEFNKGFHKVCGGRVLQLFHSHELMAVVVGNENYDWEELEKNASYKEGYTKNDPTIVSFWKIFHELPLEEKRKFLLFLTGSDRIPIQGMKAIRITIQPMTDERFLPVAHTCFNLLDLPRYQTREKLRYKLLQAIQQTQGFSLV